MRYVTMRRSSDQTREQTPTRYGRRTRSVLLVALFGLAIFFFRLRCIFKHRHVIEHRHSIYTIVNGHFSYNVISGAG